MNDSVFDHWAFGNTLKTDGQAASLEEALSQRIFEVEQEFPLTALQKNKLRLAGRGDLSRYWRDVDEKRPLFNCWKTDQNRWTDLQREISSLQSYSPNEFDEHSLFFKAVRTTLSDDQAHQYRAHFHEKRRRLFRAKLDVHIATLDRSLGLTNDQRRRLSALLNEQIRPPRVSGRYETYYIFIQMSKLPESSLRPIFDDAQWRVMTTKLAAAMRSEPLLPKFLLEPEEPADTAPPAKPRTALPPDAKHQGGDARGE